MPAPPPPPSAIRSIVAGKADPPSPPVLRLVFHESPPNPPEPPLPPPPPPAFWSFAAGSPSVPPPPAFPGAPRAMLPSVPLVPLGYPVVVCRKLVPTTPPTPAFPQRLRLWSINPRLRPHRYKLWAMSANSPRSAPVSAGQLHSCAASESLPVDDNGRLRPDSVVPRYRAQDPARRSIPRSRRHRSQRCRQILRHQHDLIGTVSLRPEAAAAV